MVESYKQYIQGTEAILPYGILRIDSRAFEGCKGLTSIKIHIEQPSEAEKVFMDMNPEYFGEIALYTPVGTGDAYRHNEFFSQFKEIIPILQNDGRG